jgi:hypothetical protein
MPDSAARRTPTDRSRARFRRAARVLGGITLTAEQAAVLARLLARTGETAAGWVRRMIAEQSRPRR